MHNSLHEATVALYNETVMFGLGSLRAKKRYGVIVDIGSSSVLIGIVGSDPTVSHPDIIWAKREHTPLTGDPSTKETAKNVLSTLLTALMELDANGRSALRAVDSQATLSNLQVTVAAPWSYTVTKTIRYDRKEEFRVTRDLIDELLSSAKEKTENELRENELTEKLGLAITARMATNLTANGYELEAPTGQTTRALSLSHSSVITQAYLRDAITDAHEKVVPNADLTTYSFMLVYYCVMRDLHPNLTDYCLVDVTFEATEIAIVRDGVLCYCTHVPFGAYSLAREVAAVTNLPLSEAYAHVTGPDLASLREQATDKQNAELDTLFRKYEERLANLLRETGDTLSIPKQLFVHSTLMTEGFFRERIERASHAVTRNHHIVTTATLPLITATYPADEVEKQKKRGADSALFVSAQFFHQCEHCDKV